jgi:hypothetical protein
MPAYDYKLFNPPAPLAKVILRRIDGGRSCPDVPMLIDTGSDVTLLPEYSVQQLGIDLESEERYELMAFDGSLSPAHVVYVDLLFLHRTFKGRFLLIDQDYGILGRNILNNLPLLLNGPQLNWEVIRGHP